jgi:hypothetical protein
MSTVPRWVVEVKKGMFGKWEPQYTRLEDSSYRSKEEARANFNFLKQGAGYRFRIRLVEFPQSICIGCGRETGYGPDINVCDECVDKARKEEARKEPAPPVEEDLSPEEEWRRRIADDFDAWRRSD